MHIEILLQLFPPEHHRPPTSQDWPLLHRTIGFSTPDDYRQIVERYGRGSFAQYIWLAQPPDNCFRGDIQMQIEDSRRRLHELRDDAFPSMVPFDIETLIPCAHTAGQSTVYWMSDQSSNPNDWPLAIHSWQDYLWSRFDGNLASLIASIFTGKFESPALPRSIDTKTKLRFYPLS